MFSAIGEHWPSCEGNKTTRHTGPEITESIHDLHEPAWWTGVRVSIPRSSELEVTVVLASRDNLRATSIPIEERAPALASELSYAPCTLLAVNSLVAKSGVHAARCS